MFNQLKTSFHRYFIQEWKTWAVYLPILLIFSVIYYQFKSVNNPLFNDDRGGYGDLAEGFLSGHLYILEKPEPGIITAPDPYDCRYLVGVYGKFDFSYFRGKNDLYGGHYYLYWGPVPALFFCCPIKLIFGSYPSEGLQVYAVFFAEFLFFAFFLLILVRGCFPHVPLVWQAVALVTFGFSTLQPYFLKYPCIYHEAIAFAAPCFMLALCFFLVAFRFTFYRYLWLGLGSFCVGLAFGCRAPYELAFFGLLAVWLLYYLRYYFLRPIFNFPFLAFTGALFLPALFCLLALGWYNYERFEDPFQNGLRLQITMDWGPVTHYNFNYFGWRYFPEGLWTYYLAPGHFIQTYPYYIPESGYTPQVLIVPRRTSENCVGIFTNYPITLCALAWPYYLGRWPDARLRESLLYLAAFLTGTTLAITAMLCLLYTLCYRYALDIQVGIVVLTCVTLFAFRERHQPKLWQSTLLIVLCLISIASGAVFGLNRP